MEEENKTQLNDKNIKVLRTYSSDMADIIRDNEASVIKIALAEKARKEKTETIEKAIGTKTSKTLFAFGGIVLIIVAIVGSYFLLQKKKDVPLPIINNIDTFISYDSNVYIDITNITNSSELGEILKQDQVTNSGLIKALFLTKKINNNSELLTSKNFLSLIRATTPSALVKVLSDKYLLGKYINKNISSLDNQTALFLIFQITDYNQAYASMLDWEKTMLKDLFILFNINISDKNESVFDKPWEDTIINNRDTRVLYNEEGKALLYYIFINRDNLIITDNIDAIKEITSRLIIKKAKPLQ